MYSSSWGNPTTQLMGRVACRIGSHVTRGRNQNFILQAVLVSQP